MAAEWVVSPRLKKPLHRLRKLVVGELSTSQKAPHRTRLHLSQLQEAQEREQSEQFGRL